MTAKELIDGLRERDVRIVVLGDDENRGDVFIPWLGVDDPLLAWLVRDLGCFARYYNRGSVLKTVRGEHDGAEVSLRRAQVDLEEGQSRHDAIWEAATTRPFTPARVEVSSW